MTQFPELRFWRHALVRWPSAVVGRMGLTEAASQYLTGVGLPVGIDWNLVVAAPSAVADLQWVNGMPVIAFDGPVPLCVDVALGGVVVAVEADGRRLVNSTVVAFGAFLMFYQDYRLRVRGLGEPEVSVLVRKTEDRMERCDRSCMAGVDGYWVSVVEQMRDGLL